MTSPVEDFIRTSVTKGIGVIASFNRKRLQQDNDSHPYLTGIHRPMASELTLTNLAVTGTIPEALDGCYLRIGPNPVIPEARGYHWFIGDGMVHGLRIEKGRALWYRNRWIRSKAVAAAMKTESAPGPRHGTFDTVNTNVVGINGRTFALVEAGSYPVELSDTLDEQTYNPFDNTLAGSFTAHPHRDPLTGEHHAICYEATAPGEIRHVVINKEGKVTREQAIPVKHGPLIHDCAFTARYVVILDLPVTFSMSAVLAGHTFPYQWNAKHEARVGLLPRNGTAEDIIWCAVEPGYVFHVANAYDLPDGRVQLDVCAFNTMFAHSLEGPTDPSRGLERWTIDPVEHSVVIKNVDHIAQEFPRIDERRFGQAHRYAYTMALPVEDTQQFCGETKLFKHDMQTGERLVHEFGPGRHPGEFVFVPAHKDSAEDEGWMIGLVVNLSLETSDLVIIDAQKFESEPVASVHIPHRVPPGFHGNWVVTH